MAGGMDCVIADLQIDGVSAVLGPVSMSHNGNAVRVYFRGANLSKTLRCSTAVLHVEQPITI